MADPHTQRKVITGTVTVNNSCQADDEPLHMDTKDPEIYHIIKTIFDPD